MYIVLINILYNHDISVIINKTYPNDPHNKKYLIYIFEITV